MKPFYYVLFKFRTFELTENIQKKEKKESTFLTENDENFHVRLKK